MIIDATFLKCNAIYMEFYFSSLFAIAHVDSLIYLRMF